MNNERGFTLVEMMITVAVIGILSSMAGPSYSRLIAKARQAEAKVELSNIYYKEQSFFSEFNRYTGCLWQIGYSPAQGGSRYYSTGFMNAGGPGFLDGNGIMCNGNPAVTDGNLVHNDATFIRSAWARDSAMNIGPVGVFGPGNAGETFRAVAWGSIYSAADIIDVWTIDPTKAILNIQTGF